MVSLRCDFNRNLASVLFVLAAIGNFFPRVHAQSAPTPTGPKSVPVLVELFTSEGCSDCPPADALLAQLDSNQPIPGVHAIVLSEHVTYWNHLGWRDPFSLDAMTQRQEDYVRHFGLDSAYTPQMVVDGTAQFVGSDGRSLLTALAKSAKTPKRNLTISNARWDHEAVQFSLHGDRASGTKLIAVLAANATHSEVARGENAGRTLHHTAVVRVIRELNADSADGRLLSLPSGPLAQSNQSDGAMRLVVFMSDRDTGKVLAAAEQLLPR